MSKHLKDLFLGQVSQHSTKCHYNELWPSNGDKCPHKNVATFGLRFELCGVTGCSMKTANETPRRVESVD